jgi:hypothetical protein
VARDCVIGRDEQPQDAYLDARGDALRPQHNGVVISVPEHRIPGRMAATETRTVTPSACRSLSFTTSRSGGDYGMNATRSHVSLDIEYDLHQALGAADAILRVAEPVHTPNREHRE